MGLSLDKAVLAVDGGGSRCRLAVEAGGERHVVEVGPANVSTDVDAAARTVLDGLRALSAATGADPDALGRLPAYLGLAGVIGPEDVEAVRARLPFRRALIEDDRPAALVGALGPDRAGAIAHCGTGSFLGYRFDGATRLAGGWGHRLGDEASATWLVRRALAAALDVADGLLPATGLTREITRELGGPRGIVVFSLTAAPDAWGRLAPVVTSAAEDGDPLARRILKDGAAYIARTLKALGWRQRDAICLTGGVGPFYARHLPAPLRDAVDDPAGAPIDGALDLARKHAGGSHP